MSGFPFIYLLFVGALVFGAMYAVLAGTGGTSASNMLIASGAAAVLTIIVLSMFRF